MKYTTHDNKYEFEEINGRLIIKDLTKEGLVAGYRYGGRKAVISLLKDAVEMEFISEGLNK